VLVHSAIVPYYVHIANLQHFFSPSDQHWPRRLYFFAQRGEHQLSILNSLTTDEFTNENFYLINKSLVNIEFIRFISNSQSPILVDKLNSCNNCFWFWTPFEESRG
jgi:hypothetical protein